tara:strand:+ start:14263 stop:14640 length:378 start_codon:yes stop_codon:yes gene_type:complete
MKTLMNKLTSLKNAFSKFLNNNLNEILVFAVTSVAAFFIFVFFNISKSIEKHEIMKENSDLMIQNLMLNYRDKQRVLMLQRQQMIIDDLERFKRAILEGNYTQNENTKQREHKVVGEPEGRDLGL